MQKFQLRTPINKKQNKFFVLLKKNRSNGMKLRKQAKHPGGISDKCLNDHPKRQQGQKEIPPEMSLHWSEMVKVISQIPIFLYVLRPDCGIFLPGYSLY